MNNKLLTYCLELESGISSNLIVLAQTSVKIYLGESTGYKFSHCYFSKRFCGGNNDLCKQMMCAQQKLMALFKHQLNTSREHVHYVYLGEFRILCCTGIGQMDKKNVGDRPLEPNCSTKNCNYLLSSTSQKSVIHTFILPSDQPKK